jgi:hypothetical protein
MAARWPVTDAMATPSIHQGQENDALELGSLVARPMIAKTYQYGARV